MHVVFIVRTIYSVQYLGCPNNIRPFWISRERVAWPWCNLAASQRRPYCASVNKSLSRGASHTAVRRRWLSLCTVWPSRSQISYLSTTILSLGKAGSRREPNLGCRGADRPGWCEVYFVQKKACTRAVEWAGVLSWWSWSARSVTVNATVTQCTISVNDVSLPTD